MHTRDQRNQRSAPRARDSRTPRITRRLDGLLDQPTQPVIKIAKITPKLAQTSAHNGNRAHDRPRIAPEAEPFHVAYLESAMEWLWRAHTAIGTIYHAYPLDDPRAIELSHILVRLDMALFTSQNWIDVFQPSAPLPEGA